MSRWRVIQISDEEAKDTDFTSAELIGISIILRHCMGLPHDGKHNVYYRAWQKLQDPVAIALEE
jgi:hypothetical protein